MQIFAEEVMPEFREADGKPDHLRQEPPAPSTHAEFAARFGRPPESARSLVTGGGNALVEHRLAHLPEIIDRTMSQEHTEQRPASAG
jgi:hypothetical protein